MGVDPELISLFRSEFELCKVAHGETLAVLTHEQSRADYAEASLIAADALGATAFQLNLRTPSAQPGSTTKTTALTGNRAAIEALKSADIVIDLVGLLWSAEQDEITAAGTRMLMIKEPAQVLKRMFPTEGLRHRVEAAEDRLAKARMLHITSPAGTDVTYRLGSYRTQCQYGYTDTPGRWDHWPGGFVYTAGEEDGVEGTVVLDVGDLIFPFFRYVNDPIRLTIERGVVTGIDGDGLDAALLRDFMRRWNDPRAYAVSHIGWGLDDTAIWDFLGTDRFASQCGGADGRAFYGNVLFSTGPNVELGGTNDTPCHLDMPLRGCDLYLDNEQIIHAGEILADDMIAKNR